MRSAPGPAAKADLAVAQNAERVSMGFRHPRFGAPGVVDHAAARAPEPPVRFFYRKRRSRGKPALWQGYGFLTPCQDVSTCANFTQSRLDSAGCALRPGAGLPNAPYGHPACALRQAHEAAEALMGQVLPRLAPDRSLTGDQDVRAWPDPGLPLPLVCPADLLHFLKLRPADLGKAQIKPLQGLDLCGPQPPAVRTACGRLAPRTRGRSACWSPGPSPRTLAESVGHSAPSAMSLDENFQRFAGLSRRSRKRRFCSCLETLRKNLRMTMSFLARGCSKELTSSNRFLQT